MTSTAPDQQITEEIVLGGAPSSIAALNGWLDALAQRRGVSAGLAHDIKLCLNEAVTNVIFHGLDGREDGEIAVALHLGPKGSRAVIRDNGLPFNPLDVPAFVPADDIASAAIGGLGIKLMLETSDRMEYRRDGETNELTLYFAPV